MATSLRPAWQLLSKSTTLFAKAQLSACCSRDFHWTSKRAFSSATPSKLPIARSRSCFVLGHTLGVQSFIQVDPTMSRRLTSASQLFSASSTDVKSFQNQRAARSMSSSASTIEGTTYQSQFQQDLPLNSPETPLTTPSVAKYLFVIAGMVFCIVVVGGMTRLTESGLSITEWNVVSGILPPIGAQDWEREFEKYRATPEWRLQNQHISLDEFKVIYLWEWSHRILGRVIGLAFLAPIPYFLMRRRLSPRSSLYLLGIGTLIGGQGALGWYMVKSGLDEQSVKDLGGVPRVSQYRLAAHLGMAFIVYASCLRLALGVGRDWKIVNGGSNRTGTGLAGFQGVETTLAKLNGPQVAKVRMFATAVTALIFLTAISGAFVAGLDAGLVYNDFPLMGGRLVPPTTELYSEKYSRKPDRSDRVWRNIFENPTTVQFDHRVLAMTTFASIVALFLYVRRPTIRSHLPPTTMRFIKGTMHMSILQVTLGISTLIYLVPIPLAATHQAGSLVLLSLAIASGASMRRPSKVAMELLKARRINGLTGSPQLKNPALAFKGANTV